MAFRAGFHRAFQLSDAEHRISFAYWVLSKVRLAAELKLDEIKRFCPFAGHLDI
jgi:hypothetical protein